MIIDTFLYFNEEELVDLRINYLKDDGIDYATIKIYFIEKMWPLRRGGLKAKGFPLQGHHGRLLSKLQEANPPKKKNLTTSLVPQRGKAGRHTNTPSYREVPHLDTLIM